MTIKPATERRLSTSVAYLYAHKCLTDAARRVAIKRIDKLSAQARRKRATLSERIVRRLAVPCTASELATILRKPVVLIAAMLHQLRKQGRVEQLDRMVGGKRLWLRAHSADQRREEAKAGRG